MLGMRGCDCSGGHLGISANDDCGSEVSHAGSSEFGKTSTPDSSLCGGRGIRGWFYGI